MLRDAPPTITLQTVQNFLRSYGTSRGASLWSSVECLRTLISNAFSRTCSRRSLWRLSVSSCCLVESKSHHEGSLQSYDFCWCKWPTGCFQSFTKGQHHTRRKTITRFLVTRWRNMHWCSSLLPTIKIHPMRFLAYEAMVTRPTTCTSNFVLGFIQPFFFCKNARHIIHHPSVIRETLECLPHHESAPWWLLWKLEPRTGRRSTAMVLSHRQVM